jgi:YHS domain-containing protein
MKMKKTMTILMGLCLMASAVVLISGCKKTGTGEDHHAGHDHHAMAHEGQTTADDIEQKTCPIMGGPINKAHFTEYQGKKVYFCCPGCEEEFAKDPEKYIKDLPQFN